MLNKSGPKKPKKPKSAPPVSGKKSTRAGAQSRVSHSALSSYLLNHRKVARESFTRLFQQPTTSLMTWGVLGIALALPMVLSVLLINAQSLGASWQSADQISLFINRRVSDERVLDLAHELNLKSTIRKSEIKWRDDALDTFRQLPGFADVVNFLDDNPLPHVIVVYPAIQGEQRDNDLDKLLQDLSALKEVDKVQLDMEWVRRLQAMTDLIERAVWALAMLLSLAVLLVIGNTTRLAIENRRDEIIVVKLVGGTDGFVRRPFLYTGVWFGLGGALFAFILVQCFLYWIETPINQLVASYGSTFQLSGLGGDGFLFLLLLSISLGWLGAWIAVRRHLDAIEPR